MAKLSKRAEKNGSGSEPPKSEHLGYTHDLTGKGRTDPCFPVMKRMVDTLGKNSTSLELFVTAMLDEIDKQGPGVLLDKIRANGGECFVDFRIPEPPPVIEEPKVEEKGKPKAAK